MTGAGVPAWSRLGPSTARRMLTRVVRYRTGLPDPKSDAPCTIPRQHEASVARLRAVHSPPCYPVQQPLGFEQAPVVARDRARGLRLIGLRPFPQPDAYTVIAPRGAPRGSRASGNGDAAEDMNAPRGDLAMRQPHPPVHGYRSGLVRSLERGALLALVHRLPPLVPDQSRILQEPS